MKEKVDVLVATYNGEKYLREQLDSIIKQTYKNIRILISDDCSKDRTQEILQEYEKKDDRIKIFLHDRNLGSNKNFEFLLRQVESKFYMLSDQDDVWLPEKIEKTIQKQKETGADLVFGDLEVVNEKLETIYPSFGDFMLLNRKINKYIGSFSGNISLCFTYVPNTPNFKGWGIFHELYKTETLIYYIENFIIMNMPAIGRGLFKIRRGFKKLKR